ncbi:hypothetical protein B0H17DRAFT_1197122 [Mycena rosella]|uniref:Uncharacterized protein n=1 Tax=Mycena rosella TaxID=1033263 RepID=A0AAD7GJV9_MYCRO|nr:hypothetical protein B0H17DRAFT_1197122 [Mycena rosella]
MDQLQDFLKHRNWGDVGWRQPDPVPANAGGEMGGTPFGRGIGAMIKSAKSNTCPTNPIIFQRCPPTHTTTSSYDATAVRRNDFTQWPQQFSERYCHLGAILPDFVKQGSPHATEALGKLHTVRWSALAAVVDELQTDYKRYTQLLSEQQVPAAIRALVVSMDLAIQRLQTRTLLELDAALTYMTVYKNGWNPGAHEFDAAAEKLVGTYTGDARIAQRLGMAGLPYCGTKILGRQRGQKGRVAPERPIQTWTLDSADNSSLRYQPYPAQSPSKVKGKSLRKAPAAESRKQPQERNKFTALDRPEMLVHSSLGAWPEVCGSRVGDTIPRSAGQTLRSSRARLLASPENAVTRQLRVHHFVLLKDALLYRLAHPTQRYEPLCSQEWRYVLSGQVEAQGRQNSKHEKWTAAIGNLLGPALKACGLSQFHGLPVRPEDLPPITLHRMREVIWEIAETNFRFELLALDRRANAARGWPAGFRRARYQGSPWVPAASWPIMWGWKGLELPSTIANTVEMQAREDPAGWADETLLEFEKSIASHYANTFWFYFGRAAVIPMRLMHELGT